jgi:SAM-dependent methyltransferase
MEQPYRLLYLLGITPWDREQVPRPVTDLAEELSTSPGQALDVGCGTGRDAVYLAGRGWTVTGVDGVPRAIERARHRARDAGAEVNWVVGDVTALQSLGIGEGYDLVLDRGCFHGLSDEGRRRCAEGISAVAGRGARMLINAFHPRRRGVGPRGITSEELERYFHDGWQLLSTTRDTDIRLPRWIGDARPTWYQFQREAPS